MPTHRKGIPCHGSRSRPTRWVPDAVDRVLTTRFRLYAIDALHNGHFGQMVALHGTTIELVPLVEAMAAVKLVPPELYAETEIFFG